VNRQQRRKLAKGAGEAATKARIAQSVHRAAQLHEAGKRHEAEVIYRDVLSVQPDNPDALHLLGVIAYETGHSIEGIKLIQQAIAIKPNHAYFNNLGSLAKSLGHLEEALGLAYRSIALDPGYAHGHNNVGVLLRDRPGGLDECFFRFFTAVALDPAYAEAHNNLGNAFQHIGRLDIAATGFARAVELAPNHAGAHLNAGSILQCQGLMGEAAKCYRKALSLKPDYAGAHSNLLMCLGYTPIDPDILFQEYKRWEQAHAKPNYEHIKPHENDRDPEKKLKVGFLSADLKQHPIAYNIEGLLATLDRTQFEVHCYAEVAYPDAFTAHLKSLSDQWTSTVGFTDAMVANTIRNDGVDILVSLAGHTALNRATVLSFKPAPIQVAYGDLSTTGMKTVDYWLTDSIIHPPEATTERFVEKLYRLPHLVIHQPPAESPTPEGPPHLKTGKIAFGSFNNPAKLTDDVIRVWSRVLQAVPNSKLYLKFFAVLTNVGVKTRLLNTFERHGVDPARVEFLGAIAQRAGHLAVLNDIDIALDPFPFTGCTTTFEALWMGVPVITLAGNRFLARMGTSFVSQVGLGDLVARSEDEYVAKAAALAADSARLLALRHGLRDTVAASRLCDREAYARSVGEAFRDMWRTWCAGAATP
jgi:predicted O-linked N-acetylglucosamine transferase (SPINDLY family)